MPSLLVKCFVFLFISLRNLSSKFVYKLVGLFRIIVGVICNASNRVLYAVLNCIVHHYFALSYITWIRFLCHT